MTPFSLLQLVGMGVAAHTSASMHEAFPDRYYLSPNLQRMLDEGLNAVWVWNDDGTATLDPRVTEWDDRFTDMRREDFTSRYGFAPDMIDAAEKVWVLYDPYERLDAMHSALFERSNVDRYRMPFFGGALQTDLRLMDILPKLLLEVADGTLDAARFAAHMRARRDHPPYLRKLLARTDASQRDKLSLMLCRHVTARMNAPRFRRRLAQLEAQKARR